MAQKEIQAPFTTNDEATPEQKARMREIVEEKFDCEEQLEILQMLGLEPYERVKTKTRGIRTVRIA